MSGNSTNKVDAKNRAPGRPKGSLNKTQGEIRAMLQRILENQIPNIPKWIASVAKTNPYKATDLILKMSDYILPRLKSMEVTGEGGKPLLDGVTFKFSTADDKVVDATMLPTETKNIEGPAEDFDVFEGTE